MIWIMSLSLSLLALRKGMLIARMAKISSLPTALIVSILETPFPSIAIFPSPSSHLFR